jgi:hypothetical protein
MLMLDLDKMEYLITELQTEKSKISPNMVQRLDYPYNVEEAVKYLEAQIKYVKEKISANLHTA